MKKSNIIIIAFSLFLFGGMLTLFIDSTYHKNEKFPYGVKNKEVLLSTFSVIVAEKNSDLHVEQSDSNKLTIEYYIDSVIPSKLYAIKRDTLYVYSGHRLFLKCKNVTTIIGRNHYWMGITNVAPKNLKIDMSDGDFYYYNTDSISKRITNLSVGARDSAFIEINDRFIENIKVNSDNSNVKLVTTSNSVIAILKHKASLNF